MKDLIKIILIGVFVMGASGISANDNKYTPMVVEGNVWQYNMRWTSYAFAKQKPWELRIEGDSVLNGIEYKCLFAYTDYSDIPDSKVPYAFLREDCDAQQVFCVVNPDYDRGSIDQNWTVDYFDGANKYKEILLYDFTNPENSMWAEVWSDSEFVRETIDVAGKPRMCWHETSGSQGSGDVYIVEGIGGVVKDGERCADLLGINVATPNGGDMGPLFHSFKSADGVLECIEPKNLPESYDSDYKPMLEDGKTWHYVMRGNNESADIAEFKKLSLNGDTIVNGKKYMKLYDRRIDSDLSESVSLCALLREDAASRRVYCIVVAQLPDCDSSMTYNGAADYPGEEVVLYDFIYPQFSVFMKALGEDGVDVLRLFLEESDFGCPGHSIITGSADYWGSYNNWIEIYSSVLDCHAESYGQIRSNGIAGRGDLLNYYSPQTKGDETVPFLYSVTDRSGKELFAIEQNRPMGGVNTVGIDATDMVPLYFDLQGMPVNNPLDGNLYIVKEGSKVYKQLYR